MSLRLLVMATVVSAVVIDSPVGNAAPPANAVTPISQAPIGHLQPRARQFSPGEGHAGIPAPHVGAFIAAPPDGESCDVGDNPGIC
jgi:hypothetical protein